MIKAIIFDFGQTLVDSADGFRSAEKIAKKRIFRSLFPDENEEKWQPFLTEYRQIRKRFHAKSDFSRPAIWQAVYDRFHCRAASEKLVQMEIEYWALVKSRTTPFPETISVLGKLAKTFRLGIITNTQGQKTADSHRIALFPEIERYFETVIIAGESDLPPKPDPQPFLQCLEKMQIQPAQAIYVGDDFEKDVCGAGDAGLHPVWLKHRRVKRSWPKPESGTSLPVIADLNELFEISLLVPESLPVGTCDCTP